MPALRAEYVDTGMLFVAFRHLPIPRLHATAMQAAQAAECGREEGKFWQMHDLIFAETALTTSRLISLPDAAGVDPLRFRNCLDSAQTVQRVRRDMTEARELGISATPTLVFGRLNEEGLFVASRVEVGALPLEAFRKVMDEVSSVAR